MRNILILILAGIAISFGHVGFAGPWPKNAGQGFISFASRISGTPGRFGSVRLTQYHSVYVEYGLTDRLTAGVDLGRSVSGGHKNIAYLRFPLRPAESRYKLSLEMGLGAISGQYVVRPGLSFGTEFGNGPGYGWMAADALAEINGLDRPDFKLDLTFGWTRPSRHKLILQLQSGIQDGDPAFLRIAPSVAFPLRDNTYVELGGTAGLIGDDQIGVMLGIWREF